jgi:phenylacetate-CoA ligase
MGEQRTLVDLMSKKIANFIGITTKIKLVERGSLKREDDRVKPFVDRRLEMTMEDI